MTEMSYSFAERYMAFLSCQLPRLKTVALHGGRERCKLDKREVLLTALQLLPPRGEGICLEFGVYKGKSLRKCAELRPERRFFGFDSFEGFPEDGRPDWKDEFAVIKLPEVPGNCTLIKGWFDETLEGFLESHSEPVDFINIDCDIYSSAKYVLDTLYKYGKIVPGTIIYFDELINYPTFFWNEMLALFELLERSNLGIEWLCVHQNVYLVDEALEMVGSGSFPSWSKNAKRGYRQAAAVRITEKGVDYGPMSLPHYQRRVKAMAEKFEKLSEKYHAGQISSGTGKPWYERMRLFIKHRIAKRGV